MENKTTQPTLRFPEFSEDWVEKKLGNLMSFKNGVNASKEDYGAGYKFVNVLDIIENDFISHNLIKGEVTISLKEFEKNKVEFGDILFQRSSETREEVGQSNVYIDEDKPATFGGFVIRGKKIADYYPVYLHYLLKTSNARKEITSKSGGSTRYNIGQTTLSEVSIISASNLNEQQKIANFLIAVDKKTTLLKEKKEALVAYKKGAMQQIFSQEIRFKNDTSTSLSTNDGNDFPDWEEKRVDELFHVTRGKVLAVPNMKQKKDNTYKYPVYSSQTKDNGLTGYYDEYLFENSITWTTDGANAGKVKFRNGKFYCTNVCGVLISIENANVCVAELLNRITHKYVSYVGNPKLMNNIMAGIKSFFPTPKEQTKIANYLSAIDTKITALEEKIKASEAFKKGVLQKMFV